MTTDVNDQKTPAKSSKVRRRRHQGLIPAVDRFLDQTAAIHDLVEVIGPQAEQLDARPRTARSVTAGLPSVLLSHDRERIGEAVADFVRVLNEETSQEVLDEHWGELDGLVRKLVPDEDEASYVVNDLARRLMTRSKRSREFYRATLVSLMTYFESLLSTVFAEYYRHFPDAMGADNKEFSLLDLRELESIEEAEELAVGSRVDKLMNGGISEWIRWFERTTKKDFSELVPAYEDFRESWERRNAFVHHGGVVRQSYLSRVPHRAGKVKVGQRLDCTPTYLKRRAEVVTAVGVTLAVDILSRIAKGNRGMDAYVGEVTYDLVYAERWEAVSLVAPPLRERLVTDSSKLTLDVNRWLANKRLEKDGWRSEVESWEVGPLNRRYVFAKCCLLDDVDQIVDLLPGLIASGDVGVGDIEHWPLAAEAREDPRVQRIIAQNAKEADPTVPFLEAPESVALAQTVENEQDGEHFL